MKESVCGIAQSIAIIILYAVGVAFVVECSSDENKSSIIEKKWRWNLEDEHPCNIRKVTIHQLKAQYGPNGLPPLHPDPIIIAAGDGNDGVHSGRKRNEKIRSLTSPQNLTDFFGENFTVTLSSSNALSERRRTIPLSEYLDEILSIQETSPDQLSNESWYLFGETFSDGK